MIVGLSEDLDLRSPHAIACSVSCARGLDSIFFNLSVHSVGVPVWISFRVCAGWSDHHSIYGSWGNDAFNLIDGVNGLCGFVTISTACALALLSHTSGLVQLETMLLIVASVVFGFFAANYPFGRIFLGDAGAYLLGHTLCWIAIAILTLRPDISPFAILLIFFWPVADTFRPFGDGNSTDCDRSTGSITFSSARHAISRNSFLGRRRRKLSNPLTVIVLAPMIVSPQIIGLRLAATIRWR